MNEENVKDTSIEEQAEQTEVVPADNPLQKNIGQKVVHRFETVIEELEDGLLRAIVNSGKKDRHGEILDMDGLDIKQYMKNPILANSHDYSKPSVGVTKRLRKQDGQLIADFKFATDVDYYDEPKILDGLYRKGYQFAFSIGFIPQEVEKETYTKATMVEFSPVLIPADGNALLLAKQKGIDKEILRAYNINNMDEKVEKTVEKTEVVEQPVNDETKNAIKDLADKLDATTKELADLKKETVEAKNINGQSDIKVTPSIDKMPKEMKFLHFVRALRKEITASEYNKIVGKGAMDTSDTSVVVPPAEFIQEIQRMEEEVGVAERFATVRRSSAGAGLKYVLGADDLTIYDTAEGGKKKSTKLTYTEKLLAWKKWAGILPITDELSEDSAVDLWADAVNRFARAFARKADELVFTQATDTGALNFGILYETGTNVVTASSATFASISTDDLIDMIYGVPSMSATNGRFYFNREMIGVLAKLKDQDDRPLWLPSYQAGVGPTILGKPYSEVEVMSGLTEEEAGLPVAAFGDLKYVTLGMRTDLQIKVFDTGSVGDPEDQDQDNASDLNLLTQDIQAMRAVKRMNAVVRFPAAFSVLKLASTS